MNERYDLIAVPIKYVLEETADYLDSQVFGGLVDAFLGFTHEDAADIVRLGEEISPFHIFDDHVIAKALIPLGVQYAVWEDETWDGDLESDSAKFTISSYSGVKRSKFALQYYSTPASFNPHIILMHEKSLDRLSERDKHVFQTALDEMAHRFGATVQATHDAAMAQMILEKGFDSVDLNLSHEDQSDLIDTALSMKGEADDLWGPLQCASGTCPCTASSVCSKKCCDRE